MCCMLRGIMPGSGASPARTWFAPPARLPPLTRWGRWAGGDGGGVCVRGSARASETSEPEERDAPWRARDARARLPRLLGGAVDERAERVDVERAAEEAAYNGPGREGVGVVVGPVARLRGDAEAEVEEDDGVGDVRERAQDRLREARRVAVGGAHEVRRRPVAHADGREERRDDAAQLHELREERRSVDRADEDLVRRGKKISNFLKPHISVGFHPFWLIFGRAIISRGELRSVGAFLSG